MNSRAALLRHDDPTCRRQTCSPKSFAARAAPSAWRSPPEHQSATPAGRVTVQRRVSQCSQIMVATQRIQVGMIHARKIVTVTADDYSFRLDIEGQTFDVVPRKTSREVQRYKATLCD